MKKEELCLGEKVDLRLENGPHYRTVIGGLDEGNTLLSVSIPTFRGIPVILRQGQALQMFVYRDTGRYGIGVLVEGFELSGKVHMVRLRIISEPERQQRRESFRVTTMLRAILRPYNFGPFPHPYRNELKLLGEMEEVPTFNISVSGVAVRSQKNFAVGDRVYMRIFLAWPNMEAIPVNILGEIRQSSRQNKGYQLGIMFLDVSEELSTHLAKFVIMEEQRRVKQQRLIEEE